jgi:peptidoglycan/LPS O-acetylase OafA/YrhL
MTVIPGAKAHPELKYRPDIDGLRAVAVLSVVLYHLGLPLHGGYVGVDIFFTISGFLIGTIILRETAERRFTFTAFYERRIRRIFPALFVMLLVSFVLAWKFLLPLEFSDFAKSLAGATFSVSNVYFWLQAGYFDAAATSKPLLHTWSLAVEEQFYLFFPILVVFLRRYLPRRVELAIYLLAATSFVISVYGAFRYPTTTFYWAHTRAWELLLGTILTFARFPKIHRPILRHLAGVVGLLLIVAALLLCTTSTPFPGLAALPPCLGAALIIAAGRSGPNVVGRVLAWKPVVFIGLISYSLYLWHWTVIVYYQAGLTLIRGLSRHEAQALQFGLSVVLAILSWRFVEVPFRSGVLRVQRRLLFQGAMAAIAVATVFSLFVTTTHGMPSRFPLKAREVAEYESPDPINIYRNGVCFITASNMALSSFPFATCLPDEPTEKKYLLVGDSHAAALWWGLDHVFAGDNVMQVNASGCKPVLHQRPRQFAACTALMDYAYRQYLPVHRVDAVLIAAHWDEGDLPSLGETLAWLRQQHIPVVLLGPIVQYDSSLPRLLALSISRNDPQMPRRHRLLDIEPLDRKMAALAAGEWHTPYISMYDNFCIQGTCTEYAAAGVPLQSDYGHLTREGSILAAQRIKALNILP